MSPRDRILERRAAFIAASLAIAGCGPSQAPPAAPSPAPPTPASSGSSTPTAVTAEDSEEVPKDASPELQARYRSLATRLRQVRAVLDRIEQGLARCASGPASAGCVAARDQAAADSYATENDLRHIRYLCKPKDPGERALAVHANAEVKLLFERLGALESKWRTTAGSTEWDEARQRAATANPVPCLSIVCSEWM